MYTVKQCLSCFCRWDTRASSEPVLKVQAHEREILAVSYSPAKDYLLLTGSADNVRPRIKWSYSNKVILTRFSIHRQSSCTICAHPRKSCTPSRVTQTRFSISHGRHTTRQSSRPRRVTAELTSGTSPRSALSRHQKIKRMVHRSSCSSTEVR